MKKGFMIAAAVLMGVGLVLVWGVVLVTKLDGISFDFTAYETNTYTADGTFNKIDIRTRETDIVFAPSGDDGCKVICRESDKIRHSVRVENGTLIIRETDSRHWYDRIGIVLFSPSMTVYLPLKEYEQLNIEGGTGDVTVPAGSYGFRSAAIQLSTGDVKWEANADNLLKIRTSTGDIRLAHVTAGTVDLAASTGDVTINFLECTGALSVKVSTGDTDIRLMGCTSFTSTGSTGDILLKKAFASQSMQITRSTGDVTFDNCDAGEITVKTSTGDVTGSLRSGKVFLVETSTGSVDVPGDEFRAGACRITTSTGDIKIRVGNKGWTD